MRKTNYQRDKRQKDLDKLKKKEEKKLRKLERKGLLPGEEGNGAESNGETPQPSEREP